MLKKNLCIAWASFCNDGKRLWQCISILPTSMFCKSGVIVLMSSFSSLCMRLNHGPIPVRLLTVGEV